jgi:penicillin-binding protein 1A
MNIISRLARLATVTFLLTGGIVIWETKNYATNPLPEIVPQVEGEPIFEAPVVFLSTEKYSLCPKYQQYIENKDLESIADFSPYLIKAVIASEDQRFYWHLGIDPLGLSRALLSNVTSGRIKEGGSAITQQLVQTLYWDQLGEFSWRNKYLELLAALKLETLLTKDQILTAYMNRVYLGGGIYGFEAASQHYFGKSATFLTLEEAAILVSIVPEPNSFNITDNLDKETDKRNGLIDDMFKLGFISSVEASTAKKTPLTVVNTQRYYHSAQYYCDYLVNQEMNDILGNSVAQQGGFIVETTLDVDIQDRTEELLQDFVVNDGRTLEISQGAIVTLDTATGEILGLTGGLDYQDDNGDIDRATQPNRQPGSIFKLFTYATALERGVKPTTLLPCDPLEWQFGTNDTPYRYRRCERFPEPKITLEDAFIYSENSPSVYLAKNLLGDDGLGRVIQTAHQFGITSDLFATPGLVIGGTEKENVSLLEITGSYGAIANNGVWTKPHGIRRIRQKDDPNCNMDKIETCPILYDALDPQRGNPSRRVMGVDNAVIMSNMLSDVIQEGTGSAASLGIGEAGKTGTTDDYVDVWFIGYVPSTTTVTGTITGVWFGNDDRSPTKAKSSDAASFWATYIKDITD